MDREVEEAEKKSEQVEEKSEEPGSTEKSEQPSDPPLPTVAATATAEKKVDAAKSGKVEVRLQAAGDAPIMKQKNYKVILILWAVFSNSIYSVAQVDGEKKISWIIQFIRKYLKLEPTDSLFLYVNQVVHVFVLVT